MATSPEAAAHGAEAPFPPFDPASYPSQLFWLALTFGVLYFVISRVIAPRISDGIDRRADKISSDLKEAADMNEQAEAAMHEADKELAAARADAREGAARTKADIEAKAAEENARIEAEVEARLTEAAARIAKARNEAMSNVEEAAASTAAEMVATITGLEVEAEDAEKAVAAVLKG